MELLNIIINENTNSGLEFLPDELIKSIIDLLLNDVQYGNFKRMELISNFWYRYMNSKKMYLYFPRNGSRMFMTPDKKVKKLNSCCSIYLDLYPNVEKRGHMKFFRREYHNFSPKIPPILAKKHNHDISTLTFSQCPYSSITVSARLYTKYDITLYDLNEIETKFTMTYIFVTGKRKLHKLNYCYSGSTNHWAFFSLFEAPKSKGKIVKSRYPNHYVIFDELYQNKLNKNNIKIDDSDDDDNDNVV